jgi:hypothetical protein
MDFQYLFFFLPFLMFIPLFVFILSSSMKRLNCPDCRQPLPLTQSPFTKTRRQWIEGGYLCENCGCETDIAGKTVPPGTLLRFGSFIRATVLMMFLIALGAVLMWFGFSLSLREPAPPLAVAPPAVKAPPPMKEPQLKIDPPPIEPAR